MIKTKKAITNIPNIYPSVTVDVYTIMPNHVHMILQIANEICTANNIQSYFRPHMVS